MVRVAIGVAALVWMNGAAYAEPSSAFGLRLPDMDSISLWKVSDRSAWGLEIGGRIARTQGDIVQITRHADGRVLREEVAGHESDSRSVAIGLIYQKFGVSRHKVRPLWFTKLTGNGVRFSRDDRSDSRWALTSKTGIGVAWTPFSRVGMWARKGLSIRYDRSNSPEGGGTERSSFSLSIGGASAEAFFTF